MKIVCDSCGAKYSIADEKVAGKVFKIRCKKCSEVIIVRGDQDAATGAPAAAESNAAVGESDAVWHVVVQGDQQGPFTPAQIGEMLAVGTIDWEAYVWREGFDNWLPARDVEPLVQAIMAGADAGGDAGGEPPEDATQAQFSGAADAGAGYAAPAVAAAAPARAPTFSDYPEEQEPATSIAQPNLSLFQQTQSLQPAGAAATAPPIASAPVAQRAHSGLGADLFAQAEASASPFDSGGDEDVVASTPQASPRAEPSLTGARNENSVLFSLSSLQALATGPGAAPAPKASVRPGMAGGEGSGLIDIRALASAAASTQPSAGGPEKKGSVDELLSLGTGASPFASGLGAPVLAPVKPSSDNKLVIGIVAAAAILVVGGGAVAFLLFGGKGESDAVAAAPTAAAVTPPAAPSPAPAAPVEPAAAPSTAAPPPAAAIEAAGASNDSARGGGSSGRDRPSTRGSSPREAAPPSPAPAAAAPPAPAAAPRGGNSNRDLDSLLEGALGGGQRPTKAARQEPEPRPAANLPAQPNRDQVVQALRAVQQRVEACGQGQRGLASTAITVASSGRVTNVNVTGPPFAGTPVGSCIARAVRDARFPQFSNPTFTVTYPFRL